MSNGNKPLSKPIDLLEKDKKPPEKEVKPTTTELPPDAEDALVRIKAHIDCLITDLQILLDNMKTRPIFQRACALHKTGCRNQVKDWEPLKLIKGTIDSLPNTLK